MKDFIPKSVVKRILKGSQPDTLLELAYCLALINVNDRYSITPSWALKSFPEIQNVMTLLRERTCLKGCSYCAEALDIHKGP